MTDGEDLSLRITDLQAQFSQVLGVNGRDLSQSLSRARRELPRPVRRAGSELAKAQPMLGNPRLERVLDFAALRAAHDTVRAHLDSIDAAEMRTTRLLRFAGLIAVYVLFVAAAFVMWMVWAGHL